jgi:hypothetical protein
MTLAMSGGQVSHMVWDRGQGLSEYVWIPLAIGCGIFLAKLRRI